MRASSLSNAKVIDLLNHYFVPVYLRNEDCSDGGAASPEEKAERNRIYRDALEAGLAAGTVCAYLLTPDARPVAVAPLNQSIATDPERLAELMRRFVDELKTPRGEPVTPPKPQSAPPSRDPDSLVLHLTARYLERTADDVAPVDSNPVLGTRKAGNWANLPSEDWIVLERPEWLKLLPAGPLRTDFTWKLDREVCAKILIHFFPPTENTDVDTNRIDEQIIQARTQAIEDGVARVRLEGRLKMKHSFYHQVDKNFVNATLVGFMDIEIEKPRIRCLRLVTDQASYGENESRGQLFGVAVRSSP